jgi:hypothetical protein
MRYLNEITDESGDVLELEIYCGPDCFREGTGKAPHGFGYPCPELADYRQYCPNCGRVVTAAIGEPAGSFDGWPNSELEPHLQAAEFAPRAPNDPADSIG